MLNEPSEASLDLQQTMAKPGQVNWQGQTLAQVLAGDAGLDALKALSNGTEVDLRTKLAAALLVAGEEGWKVYRPSRRKPARTANILTGKLLEATTREVNRVIRHKATLKVLQCVLLAQSERTLSIAGTDMETTMIVRLPFGGPDLRAAPNGHECKRPSRPPVRRKYP